jgi:hypothetical protein
MDDVRAVMDAADSQRAVVIGISEGGPMSILFAATYPERTVGLVLIGSSARTRWAPDYPFGRTDEVLARRLAIADADDWARATTLEWLERASPTAVADEEQLAWYVSYVMRGTTPAGNRALRLMNNQIDVRHVLPAISVPTLVLHRDREENVAGSRYLAERLPGATVVELSGVDHLPWEGDQDRLLDEIERFLAGVEEEEGSNRVLVTVLVVRVAGAANEHFSSAVRAQLARFGGREIESAGDGVLAVFDGPARAVRCAAAIARAVRPLGLEVRAGLHTGEVELLGDSVRGTAVQIGARVAAEAGPGEVLVSQTVRDLVAGSGLEFDDRGIGDLAGVPGEWRLLAVRS